MTTRTSPQGVPAIAASPIRVSPVGDATSNGASPHVAPIRAACRPARHRSTAHRLVTHTAVVADEPARSRHPAHTMDSCGSAHALGFALAQGELPSSVRAMLAAHAARCTSCRARLASDRQLLAALGRLQRRDDACRAPARLHARIAAMLAERRTGAACIDRISSEPLVRIATRTPQKVEA